jgi:putative hydrolase of the HAD superfamily
MITTVIFDLDDTLYDEIDYCQSGFSAVAEFLSTITPEDISEKRLFDAMWSQFMGGNHTQTFNTALSQLHIDYDNGLIRRLIRLYRQHMPALSLPPESRQVLDQLRSEFKLGMLTDGFLPAQKLKVQALGIDTYFEHIIYTEQLGRAFWKPSPVGFKKLMAFFDTPAQSMVYIGDNVVKDFIAPNQLGFTSIQLQRSNRIHTHTPANNRAQAAHTIETLSELPKLLAQLNKSCSQPVAPNDV